MAGSPESEDEEKEVRTTALETANIVLQFRQHAEQEIRRANETLEQRTRALGQALVTMRATLESTTDAILVTDELKVTDFNQKYIDMWFCPRDHTQRIVAEAGDEAGPLAQGSEHTGGRCCRAAPVQGEVLRGLLPANGEMVG